MTASKVVRWPAEVVVTGFGVDLPSGDRLVFAMPLAYQILLFGLEAVKTSAKAELKVDGILGKSDEEQPAHENEKPDKPADGHFKNMAASVPANE